jgi:cytochrome P450
LQISHNLFLFFLAGHDTSSSALTAALYFLAKHPHMQKKVFEEVQSVLGGNDEFTFADLSKVHHTLNWRLLAALVANPSLCLSQLEYLSIFLKETLRMRPPVGGTTGRTVVADGVVMGGYMIPKGIAVSPSIFSMHYDEKYASSTWR